MKQARTLMGIMSPQRLMERRQDVADIHRGLKEAEQVITARVAKVEAEYAALQQPDDLKPVFAAAYKRTVAEPAAVMKKILAATNTTLEHSEQLARFLDEHKQEIKFSGLTVEVQDQNTLNQLNELFARAQNAAKAISGMQRELQTLIRG